MTKQEFQDQQKADIKKRYSALRQEKKTRPDAMKIIAIENGISPYTVNAIMSTSSYRKPTRKN